MCGRYLIDVKMAEIFKRYGIPKGDIELNMGEIFPTNYVPIVINNNGSSIIGSKWEYTIKGINRKIINARIETIAEKRSFKDSFYNRRCIIPATSFYEWKLENNKKVKYKISVKDEKLFSMAGIYNVFIDENNQPFTGFVVVTTEANKTMSEIHNRMPLILEKDREYDWINVKDNKVIDLDDFIKPLENERVKIVLEKADNNKRYEQLSF